MGSNYFCIYNEKTIDGICGAAILNFKYIYQVNLIPFNNGNSIPWDRIIEDTTSHVFMIDCTLPMDMMKKLAAHSKLVWATHSRDAIVASRNEGIVTDKNLHSFTSSSCVLLWEHLYPFIEVPEGLVLISNYALQINVQENAKAYHEGLKISASNNQNLTPEDPIWKNVLNVASTLSHLAIIDKGNNVRAYKKRQLQLYMRSSASIIHFYGYRCLSINSQYREKDIFENFFDPSIHDIAMCFSWNKDIWNVTMYSFKAHIDLLKIAESYDGYGSNDSISFECLVLPFNL